MRTFDPTSVSISLGGVLMAEVAAAFLTISRDAPAVVTERGTEGEISRYLTDNRLGRFVLTLLATSPSGVVLSTFANFDEITGAMIFPVAVQDSDGLDLAFGAICWIDGPAEIRYSNTGETRTWTIITADMRMFQGRI